MKSKSILIVALVLLGAACGGSDDPGVQGDVLAGSQSKGVVTVADIVDIYGSDYEDYIRYDVEGHRLTYRTEAPDGSEVVVSGALLVPRMSTDAPILGLNHYTIFLESFIPSHFDQDDSFLWEGALLAASAGYVVSVPDYLGYGETSSQVHPYCHSSIATSVVDMLRAVREFCEHEGVGLKDELFLTGHSEGGYVSVATQKLIEEKHQGEFNLVATSASSGSYDMRGTADLMLASANTDLEAPGTIAYVLVAYDDAYGWNRPMTDYFEPSNAAQIEDGLLDGDYYWGQINNRLDDNVDDLLADAFFDGYASGGEQDLKAALDENDLVRWAPETPVRLYHGDQDDIVPMSNSTALYEYATGHGSTSIELITMHGHDHYSIEEDHAIETMLWFESF